MWVRNFRTIVIKTIFRYFAKKAATRNHQEVNRARRFFAAGVSSTEQITCIWGALQPIVLRISEKAKLTVRWGRKAKGLDSRQPGCLTVQPGFFVLQAVFWGSQPALGFEKCRNRLTRSPVPGSSNSTRRYLLWGQGRPPGARNNPRGWLIPFKSRRRHGKSCGSSTRRSGTGNFTRSECGRSRTKR